jgi:hypothetical protein
MFLGEGIFGLAAIALWIWAIFDVITTADADVQNLPKMIWLLLVVFLGPLGGLAWLLLGRPHGASFRIRSPGMSRSSAPEPIAPPNIPERRMSDEDFQRRREEALQKHQEELRRKEEELHRREEELRRRERGDN